MKLKRTLMAAAIAALAGTAQAQVSDGVIKIGVMNDMSSLYADIDGPAGAEMIKWAVQDFGGKVLNRPIEVLTADHQNKADVAASKAREWIDSQNLAMLVGGTSSGTNLAMAGIANEKKVPFISIGAGSARLTNENCTPYTVHYAYDTVALAKVGGSALVKAGAKKWYFLTADYAFGHALERDTAAVVVASGGQVLGTVRHPFPGQDFSSFLLQAQSSGAKVIGLANAGADTTNAIKQAHEFGITQAGQNLAGLLIFITDVHALGLETAQGLVMTEAFYVLEGQGSVVLDDVRQPCGKGSTIFIPRMTWHSFENRDHELLLFWMVTPPGLDAFFRATCSPPGAPAKAPGMSTNVAP